MINSLEGEIKALKQKVVGVEDVQDIQRQDHNQLKNGIDHYTVKTDKTLDDILNRLKELEKESAEHGRRLNELNTKLTEQANALNLLKAMNKGDGCGPSLDGIMDELRIMIENLKKECFASFVTHPEKEKLEERVDVVNSRLREVERKNNEIEEAMEVTHEYIKRHTDDIRDLKDQLAELLRQMKDLQGMSDKNEKDISELFDKIQQLMDKLREIENTLANSSSGDVDELMKKLKELEK